MIDKLPEIEIRHLQNYKEKAVTLHFADLEIKFLWTQKQIEKFSKDLLEALSEDVVTIKEEKS